ncbi:MAG: shikimate kinase [Chloroflexi bacterium]|nr:shikimate kinase [Chloroflexota bacterium]
MTAEIILIGPIGAGKSTLSRLLAEKLDLPRASMDDLRWDYYKEIGFDEAVQKQIGDQEGFPGVYRYWKPFEAHAVERLLAEQHNCVIDFGGGHSVYEDDALFARVQQILAPYPNVILILPSPDLDESVRILRERNGGGVADDFDFHEHFVKHHSNHDLAKFVVYTQGKTPEETRDEILRLLGRPGEGNA